jgi:GGDEF domain-containing protein
VAGAIGPDRADRALMTAAVLAVAVLLIAAASLAARELREQAGETRSIAGDAHRLHARLAASLAADPHRLAVLTLDVHGMDPDEIGALGQELAAQLRAEDLVARSSGDRMSVVAEADATGAAVLAQRIEQAIAQYQRDEIGDLNAAIGIATYPDDGRTPAELLSRADAAMAELRAAAAAAMRGGAAPVGDQQLV